MARHFGTATADELEELHDVVVHWLEQRNFAGSIADQYSLYDAIDDCWERAQASLVPLARRRAMPRASRRTGILKHIAAPLAPIAAHGIAPRDARNN